MEQKIVVRYSEAFKIQVVNDLESGRFDNINQATKHYGIKGPCTITKWLKKYGRNHLCPKVIYVKKPNEQDQIKQLRKEIKELQMALGITQTEKVLEKSFLKIACEKLGTDVEDFKKKSIYSSALCKRELRRNSELSVPGS